MLNIPRAQIAKLERVESSFSDRFFLILKSGSRVELKELPSGFDVELISSPKSKVIFDTPRPDPVEKVVAEKQLTPMVRDTSPRKLVLIKCRECASEFNPYDTHNRDGYFNLCSNCYDEVDVQKFKGEMIWTHKTAPEIVIHDEGTGKTIKDVDISQMYKRR